MATFSGNIEYYASFYGHKNVIQYRVEIRKAGYSGSSSQIANLGPTPLIYQHVDVEGSGIQGSEMVFTFICNNADYAEFDLLTQGSDFDYQFQLYDVSDTSRALWTGYILPNETARGYFSHKSIYSLTANDYLSRLKNIQFTNAAGLIPALRTTIANILGWVLNKIPNFHDVLIQCGLVDTNMSGAGSPLNKAYVFPDIFSKVQNGILIPSDCYDVLDNILRVFNCRICTPLKRKSDFDSESDTRYYILNNDQTNGLLYNSQYNSGTDTLPAYKTFSFTSIINIDGYVFGVQSELSRKLPVKALNLVQHNQEGGQSVTADNFYDVTNNVIWSRVGISTITSDTELINIVSSSVSLVSLRLYKWYILANTTGNRFIRLNFVLQNLSLVSENISVYPVVKVYQKDLTGTVITKTENLPLLSGHAGLYIYISPSNAMYQIVNGFSYQVEISFYPVGAAAVMRLGIRNFTFTSYDVTTGGESVANIMTDEVYSCLSDPSASQNNSIEIKLGDSLQATNKAGITYDTDNTHMTSAWHRYGVSESKSIQELILQSYFNRFGGSAKLLKITVFDEACTINMYNKIQVQGLVYQILDYSRDFKKGTVDLRLLQLASSDVSISVTKNNVPVSGPNSGTGSTSGGTSTSPTGGGGVTDHGLLTGLGDDDHKQYLLRTEYTPGGLSTVIHDITLSGNGTSGTPLHVISRELWQVNPAYGYLYNFYTLTNIAATGYHVPTQTEWNQVLIDLTAEGIVNPLYDSELDMCFGAAKSGNRAYSNGAFYYVNEWLYLWSSTVHSSTEAYFFLVAYDGNQIDYDDKRMGIGVRLFRDNLTGYIDGELYTGNDGKQYRQIKIGNNVLLAENLAETKDNTGTNLAFITTNANWVSLGTSPGYCLANNNTKNLIHGVSPKCNKPLIAIVYNYSNNAAALAAGLQVGEFYRNGDVLQIVH